LQLTIRSSAHCLDASKLSKQLVLPFQLLVYDQYAQTPALPLSHWLVIMHRRLQHCVCLQTSKHIHTSLKLSLINSTCTRTRTHTHTHTHMFNGPLSGTTRVSRYQKGKTNVDFTEARDSEWHWNPLGHMQVCTSLQTDNHASTSPLSFLQAGCPSCCPTNSVNSGVTMGWLLRLVTGGGPLMAGGPHSPRVLSD